MSKFVLKSKTILGALVAILPELGILFGFTFTEDGVAFVSQSLDSLIQIAGGAFAIYGRFKAEGEIHV